MTQLRHKIPAFPCLLAATVLLSSCASYPPAPVADAGGAPDPEVTQRPPSAPAGEAQLRPAPRTAPESSVGSRQAAVAALLARCQEEYQSGQYPQSVATAERALRIDRRNAEVYLWLAKNYDRLGDTEQAVQFAQRGLRYSGDDRSLSWQLERLIRKSRN